MTVRELIDHGACRLREARPDDATRGVARELARQEAEWLLASLLERRPLELYLQEEVVPQPLIDAYFGRVAQRARGVPLQYVLGETEFFGHSLRVSPGVFIPRPETEVITEAALRMLRARSAAGTGPLRLLELGTGSGCIALTLARHLPACLVVAVEVSWVALRIARENLARCQAGGRVRFVQGRWARAIRGTFDGIISNPPYIPSPQVDRLPLDVRQEPRESLDGGPDGLTAIAEILALAPSLLAPSGLLILECGEEQAGGLAQTLAAAEWVERVQVLDDLAQRPRGLIVTRKE